MPACSEATCTQKSDYVGRICHSDGFSGNIVYITFPDGSGCYCKCSCVSASTLIMVSDTQWRPIQDVAVGDSVLTLQSDKTWQASEVKFSDGTNPVGSKIRFVVYLKLSTGAELVVTPEHPFLLPNGSLQTASRLSLSDRLVNENMAPVKIDSLAYGEYNGVIRNIATSVGGPGETLDGHLINTAGVISGDFYAQMYLVDSAQQRLPMIGSSQYVALHGDPNESFQESGALRSSDAEESAFTPYRKFAAPTEYVSFIPPGMDIASDDMLHPLDYTIPLEMAEYLIHHFNKFYPDIIFNIDWANNDVNAVAWRRGSEQHITIYGGIIRHRAVKVEGLALVFAHETGHHMGGAPKYPNIPWASCEGQADYWGALIAMREIWWGEESLRQLREGATQLYNLFAFGLTSTLSDDDIRQRTAMLGFCAHPEASCRYQTYMAAAFINPKPACAGDLGLK
jgi:hypothetical protein